MSIFGKTLSIWKLTKLSLGQGDFNDIFWPAGPFTLAFSVTSRLHPNFNKNRIKLILNRVVVGRHGFCHTINRPAALRAMGNVFFTFPWLLTQAVLRAFLFVDQELHLIEI